MKGKRTEKTPKEVTKAANAVWASDGLTLSARTTKGAAEVTANVSAAISESIKNGDTVKKTLIDLFDGYGEGGIIPEQDIPKFMKEVIKKGRFRELDSRLYKEALRRAEREVRGLKTEGLKAAYKQVMKAVEKGNEKRIQKAIYVATQEQIRYYAERIARTELARAHNEGFFSKWNDDEDCVAFKWKLNSRHPVYDICNLYAEADLYGMGKGIFPKDKGPALPVHPHCMCHLRPVFVGSSLIKGEERDQVEKGGKEWLERQTKSQRERILGVYGSQNVAGGFDWRTKARGYTHGVMGSRLAGRNSSDIIERTISLDEAIPFYYKGEYGFIPAKTVVSPKRVIAGAGVDTLLRIAEMLSEQHGGDASRWQKVWGLLYRIGLSSIYIGILTQKRGMWLLRLNMWGKGGRKSEGTVYWGVFRSYLLNKQ